MNCKNCGHRIRKSGKRTSHMHEYVHWTGGISGNKATPTSAQCTTNMLNEERTALTGICGCRKAEPSTKENG